MLEVHLYRFRLLVVLSFGCSAATDAATGAASGALLLLMLLRVHSCYPLRCCWSFAILLPPSALLLLLKTHLLIAIGSRCATTSFPLQCLMPMGDQSQVFAHHTRTLEQYSPKYDEETGELVGAPYPEAGWFDPTGSGAECKTAFPTSHSHRACENEGNDCTRDGHVHCLLQ